jgi:hypothetical protein
MPAQILQPSNYHNLQMPHLFTSHPPCSAPGIAGRLPLNMPVAIAHPPIIAPPVQFPTFGLPIISPNASFAPAFQEIPKQLQAHIVDQTLGQRRNPIWFLWRRGRVTGSIFKRVCTNSGSESSRVSLVNDIVACGGNALDNVPAIAHGNRCELLALAQYRKNNHRVAVTETGFWIDRRNTWFGSSPDAICVWENKIVKVVEIKCPLKDNPKDLDYLCDIGGRYCLSTTHAYYFQVQAHMHVTEVELCDFVVWTSRWMEVIEISYDAGFMREKLSAGKVFFANNVCGVIELK